MIRKIFKSGDSLAVTIPRNILRSKGIDLGDYVSINDDAITKVKMPEDPKGGK